MRVIIVGAGTVGANIALYLSREGHEVVVVDWSREKLGAVEDEIDVQTIQGNGCDPSLLEKIGISKTGVLLAVTDKDETNLICCYAAKKMKCARVVARVRARFYYDTSHVDFREPFGIDLMISPESLTAYQLVRFVAMPTAVIAVSLADGQVQLRTVRLSPESEFVGKEVREMEIPGGALIAAIRRGENVHIAHGKTRLEAEDRVTLIGLPEMLDLISYHFNLVKDKGKVTKVAIAGAGDTGIFLAQLLEHAGHRVVLLEQNRERAEFAGEHLNHTRVLHADATDIHTLREERIGGVDYYIAAMGDDEANIMSSMLARELGAGKTACLIDRPDYARIVEKMGIDVAISPRFVVANRVLAMVKRGRIRSVTLLEEGALEINEFQAVSKSQIVGQKLMDLEIPDGILIGAVVEGTGDVVIPRGDYVVKPGAIVIGIALTEEAEKLDKLFAAPSGDEE